MSEFEIFILICLMATGFHIICDCLEDYDNKCLKMICHISSGGFVLSSAYFAFYFILVLFLPVVWIFNQIFYVIILPIIFKILGIFNITGEYYYNPITYIVEFKFKEHEICYFYHGHNIDFTDRFEKGSIFELATICDITLFIYGIISICFALFISLGFFILINRTYDEIRLRI